MSIRTLAAVALAALLAPALSAQVDLYEQPASGIASGVGPVANDTFGWIFSENFLAASDDIADTYLADDFVVPEDTTWSIQEVSVVAFYAGGTQKARDFNIIFWSHDPVNGTPDTELFRISDIDPTTDGIPDNSTLNAGVLSFTLDTPVHLTDGTYWLTVQANSNGTLTTDRYAWRSDATAIGDTLQFWNYGGGLNAEPCVADWGTNSPVCGNRVRNSNEPSVYFKLAGGEWNVASEEVAQSHSVEILPTRPNPASGRTLIPFTLHQPADVRLAVYDVLGREVELVTERSYSAGEHAEPLDTSDFAPGTYVVRLVAGPDVVLRTLSVAR
ncbi:MAG: hypothetical protein Rubg2KO_23480 [Rubricoccaceae bacterium]